MSRVVRAALGAVGVLLAACTALPQAAPPRQQPAVAEVAFNQTLATRYRPASNARQPDAR